MTARGARFARIHGLLSGNPLTRLPLLPFALIWEAVAAVRRWFYDRGLGRVRRLSRPVVGVGGQLRPQLVVVEQRHHTRTR